MPRRGFTLIEFVMVIIITGALAVVLVPVMKTAIDAYFSLRLRNDIVSESRLALNRVIREIRQIDQITAMNSTDLTFTDINNETVRFHLDSCGSASCLKRYYSGLDNIMVDDLDPDSGLTFTYLDANGAQTGVPGDVRTIRLKLIVNAGGSNFTIQSSGGIRNAQ